MDKIFICSPYRGDTKKNLENAYRYCHLAAACGYIPIAPHTIFPNFMNDNDEEERLRGIRMGLELMKDCTSMWVFGNDVTEGMSLEIRKAMELGLPINFHDAERKVINHDTIDVDRRLSEGLRQIIKDTDSYCRADKGRFKAANVRRKKRRFF